MSYKILVGTNVADLESKLNAEPEPFQVITFSGNNALLKIPTPVAAKAIVQHSRSKKTNPDGSYTVTEMTVLKDGTKTERSKDFNKDGTEK